MSKTAGSLTAAITLAGKANSAPPGGCLLRRNPAAAAKTRRRPSGGLQSCSIKFRKHTIAGNNEKTAAA